MTRLSRVFSSPRVVATSFSLILIGASILGLVATVLGHDYRVLTSSRLARQRPVSVYPHMPVPGTSDVEGSEGAAGADFSQVYTSGLALRHGESAYNPTTPAYNDVFGRPPGYPPLMNWLYLPLTYLSYANALLVHTLAMLAALFAVSAFLLWKMQLPRQIAPVLLAQACLFLLTPIGFTHFERGQFDIYATIAAALCVACSYWPASARGLALASGAIGALKWTVLPFLGCFTAFGFLVGPKSRRWTFFAIPLITAVTTALFYKEVKEYWHTIQVYELEAVPNRLSLTFQHFVPRMVAKALPVVATLLPAIVIWAWKPARARRDEMFRALAVPFSLALMNLSICFGTLSYEYHTVSTLGMLPGVVVWLESEPHVSLRLKALTAGLYAAFLVVAFRIFELAFALEPKQMSAVYAACALLLLGLCMQVIRGIGRRAVLDAQAQERSLDRRERERRGEQHDRKTTVAM